MSDQKELKSEQQEKVTGGRLAREAKASTLANGLADNLARPRPTNKSLASGLALAEDLALAQAQGLANGLVDDLALAGGLVSDQ